MARPLPRPVPRNSRPGILTLAAVPPRVRGHGAVALSLRGAAAAAGAGQHTGAHRGQAGG